MTNDVLPKQFLSSVKVLFDILDSKNQGFISVSEIETKWNKENTDKLPSDVIESLHSVAPPNGRLNFELFVHGLRKSLTAKRSQSAGDAVYDENRPPPKPSKPLNLQQRSVSSPFIKVKSVSRDHLNQGDHNLNTGSEYSRSQSTTDLVSPPKISPRTNGYINPDNEIYKRQIPRRRDSTRRHTLGHGVDGSMLRRSKLLEEERRTLLKGLQAVDKARNWYTKRLSEVSDKQRFGASDITDQSTDQQQERINFEKLRITELNQQIEALTEPGGQGGLMRMNLARPIATRQQTIPYEINEPNSNHAVQLMRAQNRMLTKEVSQKTEKISQLEKEKATLLKDLFESRANQRIQQKKTTSISSNRQLEDTTLM